MYWHLPRSGSGSSYRAARHWPIKTSGNRVAAALGSSRSRRNMDNRPNQSRPSETRIRHELVERVRREIAAGTYETPQKLELALERLLERLKEE